MSLAIVTGAVCEVLLMDGWHAVADGSFTLDAYEFLDRDPGNKDFGLHDIRHGGGDVGICSRGFSFVELVADPSPRRRRISGPLTSVLAVRESARTSAHERRPLSRALVARVVARDGLNCQICSKPVDGDDLHIDHVVRVRDGGTNDVENLRVTHSTCNLARESVGARR